MRSMQTLLRGSPHLRLRSLAVPSTRAIYSTPSVLEQGNESHVHTNKKATRGGQDPSVSQGHAVLHPNESPQDVQSEHARAGFAASRNSDTDPHPLDAASRTCHKTKPHYYANGNKEGVGFVEQVGGASASADKFAGVETPLDVADTSESPSRATVWEGATPEVDEDATPPSLLGAVKKTIPGWPTSTGEVKQNRGGGQGVTGTGTLPRPAMSGTSKQQPGDAAQWEGKRNFSTSRRFSVSAGRPDAGKSQKNKEVHFARPDADEDRLAGSRFGNQSQNEPTIHPQRDSKRPGTDANAAFPSGEFLNSGEPTGDAMSAVDEGRGESKEYKTVSREDPYDEPEARREEKLRYGGRQWGVGERQEGLTGEGR